jgi:hypothetical protein
MRELMMLKSSEQKGGDYDFNNNINKLKIN